jgi:hypothetical protein
MSYKCCRMSKTPIRDALQKAACDERKRIEAGAYTVEQLHKNSEKHLQLAYDALADMESTTATQDARTNKLVTQQGESVMKTPAKKTSFNLKIEAGIPVPAKRRKGTGFAQVLRAMKVGDSVFVPTAMKSANTVMVCAHYVLGTGNYKTRSVDDGMRVWKTR